MINFLLTLTSPQSFLYGPPFALSAPERPRAVLSQYRPRARLIRSNFYSSMPYQCEVTFNISVREITQKFFSYHNFRQAVQISRNVTWTYMQDIRLETPWSSVCGQLLRRAPLLTSEIVNRSTVCHVWIFEGKRKDFFVRLDHRLNLNQLTLRT